MFLNTFKIFIISILLISCAFAQNITFKVPDGWEKNETLSIKGSEIVFSPKNQKNSPIEYLTIKTSKALTDASKLLWNNFIEIKKEYDDFYYYKPLYTPNESMGLGCSVKGSFCIVQRIQKYEKELFVYSYINNKPHYSQGFFGKWTNICAQITPGVEEKLEQNNEVFEL